MTRFFDGARPDAPPLPAAYFPAEAADAVAAFSAEAAATRDAGLMERYPFTAAAPARYAVWHGAATRLVVNWLREIASRRGADRSLGREAAPVTRLPRAV